MKRKTQRGNVNYVEITKSRYYHVISAYKYVSLGNDGVKHFYLARKRKELDDERNERDLARTRKRIDDKINEFKQR